jgi:putative transposase
MFGVMTGSRYHRDGSKPTEERRGRSARKARAGVDRAVVYRLYPTALQKVALAELLECQRTLYNAALQERRGAWRWERRTVTRFEQFAELSGAHEVFPWLTRFGVSVARGSLVRLDEAFAHFFRRVRLGEKPGFPRFKSTTRWDSVQWADTHGWRLVPTGKGTYGRLRVQGVGPVKVKLHRRFRDPARPAKLVVRRRGDRFEAIVFWRDVQVESLARAGKAAGIDLGVVVWAAVAASDGHAELIENPAPLRQAQNRLASAQRAVTACTQESRRCQRARARVTRLHRRIANSRQTAAHRLSARLIRDYDTLYLEDLKIVNMTRSARGSVEQPGTNVAAKAGLNRGILDAGWGQLVRMLAYKAEGAGRTIVRIPPAHTSQTCARCGHTHPDNRPDRDRFSCRVCGHQDHADHNAARVILRIGEGSLKIVRPKRIRPGPEPGHPLATAGRDAA